MFYIKQENINNVYITPNQTTGHTEEYVLLWEKKDNNETGIINLTDTSLYERYNEFEIILTGKTNEDISNRLYYLKTGNYKYELKNSENEIISVGLFYVYNGSINNISDDDVNDYEKIETSDIPSYTKY